MELHTISMRRFLLLMGRIGIAMRRQNLLTASMEAVRYQGKSLFFQELTLIYEQMKETNSITTKAMQAYELDKTIRKHTGLLTNTKVGVTLDMLFNACAMPPRLNPNSPFDAIYVDLGWGDVLKDYVLNEKKLRKLQDSLTATLDRNKGRVSGLFSKISLDLTIGRELIRTLPASQVAAVTLHEIGHLFTFFEILVDTTLSNLAIGAASEALANATSPVEKLAIVHSYERARDKKVSDPKALSEAALNKEGYQAVLIRELYSETARSGTGTPLYDFVGSEFAADHFASMHGAGRDIVLALEVIDRMIGYNTRQSQMSWMITQAIGTVVVLAATAGVVVMPLLLFIPLTITLVLLNPKQAHDSYDPPKARAQRVRNNLVQVLKNRTLDPEDRDAVIADIEFIDKLTEDMVDRQSLLMLIWGSLTPYRRKQYKQIQFQKELESVINNNLFISAGKLNQMTSKGA